DEPVRLDTSGGDARADRRVAQERDRDFIDLQVAAAGGGERRDLLAKDRAEIGEEARRIRIDSADGENGAAGEMHGRGRRDRDLRRHPRRVAQERELVERERPRPRDRASRIRCRELDLMALAVPEPEDRLTNLEALSALDEAAPIGSAAELAVG